MSDLVPAPPRVVPHDPAWASAYQAEAALLTEALAGIPHRLEHIGSTAVPGLSAKPVLDVMVGVVDHERFAEIREALEGVGYVWDPAAERDEPARKVFRKGPADHSRLRTHHLHLTVEDGPYWRRILAFRDHLRRDPVAAAEYAAVKAELVQRCGGDSRAYTRGKTDVVRRIEHLAAAEAEVVLRLRAAGCVFAEDEARLLVAEAGSPDELEEMVTRRTDGVPLEHILGWAEFCGMRVVVAPGVFVPRRRTELLAREALEAVRGVAAAGEQPVVVDMCCGTAAVGALVARSVEGVELYAVDVEAEAARCARVNVGEQGRVHEGDLYDALPDALGGRVHVIAANAPYVPTEAIATMPPDARDHEPRVALDGGGDGLDVQRRVVAGAADWLVPGGHLLVETSRLQAPGTVELFTRHGLDARVVRDDDVDGTVVVGTLR